MDYSNHSKNHGGYNDLSIDVGHQMSEHPLLPDRHGHPYHSGIDMHNRCCSGRFWCIQDICGIICAILTCKDYATIFLNYKTWSYRFTFTGFLILYAKFVVYFVILIPAISNHTIYCIFNMIIFLMLSSLAFSSHIRTMLTDPVSFPRWTSFFPVLITESHICRELSQEAMPPKRWSSKWASSKDKSFSNARNAVPSNLSELITAQCVTGEIAGKGTR